MQPLLGFGPLEAPDNTLYIYEMCYMYYGYFYVFQPNYNVDSSK